MSNADFMSDFKILCNLNILPHKGEIHLYGCLQCITVEYDTSSI